MKTTGENKKILKDELLKLKLKSNLTPEEKSRVQKLQQILFGEA